jgi:hypothetical protein
MAKRTGGGAILFGLNEETDFKNVGVGDAHRLQEDLTSLARQLARLVLPIEQLVQTIVECTRQAESTPILGKFEFDEHGHGSPHSTT